MTATSSRSTASPVSGLLAPPSWTVSCTDGLLCGTRSPVSLGGVCAPRSEGCLQGIDLPRQGAVMCRPGRIRRDRAGNVPAPCGKGVPERNLRIGAMLQSSLGRMVVALLLAPMLALLLAPATAHAGWKIDRATRIAAIVWHNPCPDGVTLRWGTSSPDRGGEAFVDQCAIAINSDVHTPWEEFCTTVLHEYGHLAGYRDPSNVGDPLHSRNPMSVMYLSSFYVDSETEFPDGRVVRQVLGGDRRCRDRGRPFLRAHGGL